MGKQPKAGAGVSKHGKPSSLLDTRMIYCGDNLEQLKKLPDGCVDLIYIDPPFNSNRNYEVFWGETKEKRSFEDRHASTQAYIDYMRPRCIEPPRLESCRHFAIRGRLNRMPAPATTHQRVRSHRTLPIGNAGPRVAELLATLPKNDSDPAALQTLLEANRELRHLEWPEPFNHTSHTVRMGDARELSFIPDESVHLVVTSPPYWTLKKYNDHAAQMGSFDDYEHFLDELDKVWRHCLRILVPGGRVCCNVGDVCIARKQAGRHYVVPLHSDLQVRARKVGFDLLTPILWAKISNGVTEAAGNGAGFYGKPYQPGAIVKNDVEHILFFRKGGKYRSVSMAAKALSMLSKVEMQAWFRSIWTDVPGTSSPKHPAPYPVELASRLVRMFSFAGDTLLDPFLGTGTTMIAAMQTGRNSIGIEIDPVYAEQAIARCRKEVLQPRGVGATDVSLFVDAKMPAGDAE